MEQFIQVLVDGIATGSIYGAMALALVLIFRSTGVVNFAQGEMAMFSTFIAWGLHEAGVPLGLAVLSTLALSFVAGMVIERVLIRHFEGGEVLTLVIVTLGLFILLNSLAGWIWGFGNRDFDSLFGDGTASLGGVQLSVESLGIVAVLLGVVGLLVLLFQRTKVGLAMRAAALNPESSALVGVRVGRMLMLGWGLAAALGALAGALVAPRLFLDVNLMGSVLIYAFAAAALGGFDSALGAVVGGWVIGVSENLAGTYVDFIGADLKILVPLVIIFVVLLVKPSGLFGTREVARA
jgi:branched-chain amino acid transport system permease protein